MIFEVKHTDYFKGALEEALAWLYISDG